MKSLFTPAGADRRNFLIFCLVLAAALVAFYFPFLAGRKSFYLSDLNYYYEPFLRFIGDALRHHRLPTWNPYCYCGMAQIAVPSPGIFYPPDWLFAFLKFSPALAIYMIVHQLSAGIGAYVLVLSLGWGGFAAATCGITVALGGYMFSLQKNFSLVSSAAWFPFLIWSLRLLSAGSLQRRMLSIVACAFATFMLLAAGRPEIGFPLLVLAFAYVALPFCNFLPPLRCSYNADRKDGKETCETGECDSPPRGGRAVRVPVGSIVLQLFSIGLGTLLAAPVILPAMEWTALSPRSHGLNPAEVFRWSANWYDWLCVIASQPLGDLNLISAKYLSMVATRGGYIPFLSSAFVGPVVFTLAIWGVFDRRWRARWILFAVLAASTVLTLGYYTPVLPWLIKHFPVLGAFRYPIKLIILPVWCIVLLAGRGAFYAGSRRLQPLAQRTALAFWSVAVLVFLALASIPWLSFLSTMLKPVCPSKLSLSAYCEGLSTLGLAGLRAAVIGLAVCYVAHLYCRGRLAYAAFAGICLCGIIGSQLACAFAYSRHGTEPDFFNRDSVLATKVKWLAKKEGVSGDFRILTLYFDPLTAPPWYHGRKPHGTNALFYQYGRQLLLPQTNMDYRLPSSFGYEAAETADYRQIYSDAFHAYLDYIGKPAPTSGNDASLLTPLERFCRMTATRYVFTQVWNAPDAGKDIRALDGKYFELVDEDRRFNLRVYRLKSPMPRAHLSGEWRWLDSHDQAVKLVSSPAADAFDPSRTTILERPADSIASLEPEAVQPGPATLSTSWVKVLTDTSDHLSLSVDAGANCLVVLSDHFYPGWRAKVDNVPAELYRANAISRAVFVRPGPHLVEFDYVPDSLYYGLELAAISLAIIAGLLIAASLIYWREAHTRATT